MHILCVFTWGAVMHGGIQWNRCKWLPISHTNFDSMRIFCVGFGRCKRTDSKIHNFQLCAYRTSVDETRKRNLNNFKYFWLCKLYECVILVKCFVWRLLCMRRSMGVHSALNEMELRACNLIECKSKSFQCIACAPIIIISIDSKNSTRKHQRAELTVAGGTAQQQTTCIFQITWACSGNSTHFIHKFTENFANAIGFQFTYFLCAKATVCVLPQTVLYWHISLLQSVHATFRCKNVHILIHLLRGWLWIKCKYVRRMHLHSVRGHVCALCNAAAVLLI